MTNLSLAPATDMELQEKNSIRLPEPHVDLPEKVLRERAARYILVGPHALSPDELYEAQAAIMSRVTRAEESGITPRDVLMSLLRSAFSNEDHCRCSSCRQRCTVCGSPGIGG